MKIKFDLKSAVRIIQFCLLMCLIVLVCLIQLLPKFINFLCEEVFQYLRNLLENFPID